MPTYLSPGVYVEEVQRLTTHRGRGHGGRRLRGLRVRRPVPHADPGDELEPVRRPVRRLRRGQLPGPRGLRVLQQRRRIGVHRPGRQDGEDGDGASRRSPSSSRCRASPPRSAPTASRRCLAGGDDGTAQRRGHRRARGPAAGQLPLSSARRGRTTRCSRPHHPRKARTNVATGERELEDGHGGGGGRDRRRRAPGDQRHRGARRPQACPRGGDLTIRSRCTPAEYIGDTRRAHRLRRARGDRRRHDGLPSPT